METQTAKITKKIGFDRMAISAKFPSGASLKFSIGRSGETLDLRFSNDRSELKKQSKIMSKWLDFKKGEKTNAERFDRIESFLAPFKSGAQVMAAIS